MGIRIVSGVVTTRAGLKLAVDRAGSPGDPMVVLLHGGGQTRASWKSALATFAEAGFFAVSYDARGHGESDWAPDGNYAYPQLAEDLVDVVGDRNRSVALIGASMGGMTAYLAEGASLLTIGALLLVDIVPSPAIEGAVRVRDFMTAFPEGFDSIEQAADAIAAYYPQRPRSRSLSGLQRNLRLGADGRYRWHWDPLILNESGEDPVADVRRWATAMAPRITAPTLIVRAGASDMVDEAALEQARTLLPHAEVAEIAGSGHMIAGDKNDAFIKASLEFVTRHLKGERATA